MLSLRQVYEANRKSRAVPNILLAHNLAKKKKKVSKKMKEIMQVYIFGACFSSCYCIYKKKSFLLIMTKDFQNLNIKRNNLVFKEFIRHIQLHPLKL